MPCSQIDLPYQHIYHIYYNKIRNFFKQFLCIFFILSGFAGKYDNAVRFLLLRGFQKAKLIFRFQKSASGAIRYDKLTMKPFLSRVKCVCLQNLNKARLHSKNNFKKMRHGVKMPYNNSSLIRRDFVRKFRYWKLFYTNY